MKTFVKTSSFYKELAVPDTALLAGCSETRGLSVLPLYSSYLGHHSPSVQLLSRVQLFATPWTAARQASLSITNSWSSLRLTSIESVMPSSHLILCRPLFLLPPMPPSIRVFSNESTLRMRWPKYWSFSFSISPSKEHPGVSSFRMDWLDLLAFTLDVINSLAHPEKQYLTYVLAAFRVLLDVTIMGESLEMNPFPR